MSRKSKRNRPNATPPQGASAAQPQAKAKAKAASRQPPRTPPQAAPKSRGIGRKALFGTAVALLLAAFVVGTLVYRSEKAQSGQQAATQNRTSLVRDHAPTLGKADARVHIVEFLDPACGTCAQFYPEVKKIMAANPDRIRLTIRHVPFHTGAELAVRVLEASRSQGKYWQALEALFATQQRWVVNHAVVPDQLWPSLAGAGLDLDRVRSEMNSPEISRRIEQDLGDARTMGVKATPEYFVNGRPMPSFGLAQLKGLVDEELKAAYR